MRKILLVLGLLAFAGLIGFATFFPSQVPSLLLSQEETEEEKDRRLTLGYLKPTFEDLRDGISTDPSLAAQWVVRAINEERVTFADLGTTEEEVMGLVDQYGVGLSKHILEKARAGTYAGNALRLQFALSDLQGFGYTLEDLGFTQEEFNALLKEYSGDLPRDATGLTKTMGTY